MINFDEELKRFKPSLEVDDAEKAIYDNNSPDLTEIFYKMIEDIDMHALKNRAND